MINLLVSILLIVSLVGCANNEIVTGKVVKNLNDKISVRLPIPVIEAAFTPFYSAIDQGYYSQEGIDIEFNLGSPENNPVKMVASGVDDFGILGGPDTLLVARSNGQLLVAIGVIHKDSNFPVILTLKSSGLTKLEDLQGKKVGFFYGHISTDVLRNVLRKNNINVEEVDVGFNYNPLIAGQIDAEWAFRTTAGINLPKKGIGINVITPKDYGINTHGYTIFTTEDMIKNNPELVKKFLKATLKGVEYTVNNPDTALEYVLKREVILNKEIERERLEEYNKVTSATKQYPPGYMDKKMFQETYDRLKEEKVLANDFDVSNAFTTKFLDEIYS